MKGLTAWGKKLELIFRHFTVIHPTLRQPHANRCVQKTKIEFKIRRVFLSLSYKTNADRGCQNQLK